MQLAQGKSTTCFICFGIGNISNFAVVKSLRKLGGCVVDNNFFFLIFCFSFYLGRDFVKLILWLGL